MAGTSNLKLKDQIKKQIDSVSAKLLSAEKVAEKQVRSVLKKTDKVRKDQLKNVRKLLKDAQKLNSGQLIKKAEELAKQVETEASGRYDYLLKRLRLPSQKEIDRLNKKVSALEKKLKSLDRDLFGSS